MTLYQALRDTGYARWNDIVVTERQGYMYALSKFLGIERRSLESILTALRKMYPDNFNTGWQPVTRDDANKLVSTTK